jgi:uncharacterized membrane protein
MDWVLVVLRVLHIGAGIFWVGSAFLFFFFVEPSTRVLSPDPRQGFLAELMGRRRAPAYIFYASLVTVLAGLALYWRASAGLQPEWITSPNGIGFTIGGLGALASFFIGALVIVPTIRNLGMLGAQIAAEQRPPTESEAGTLERFERRLAIAGRWDLVGLSIAVLFMAIARYL